MQTPNDITLLRRWRDQRDARAFQTLTQRYGGLVFNICNRVLKNSADAEEVTQDCFLKLAQHPLPPDRSIGPWLHSVAVRSAVDRIRAETCRRQREANFENARPKISEYTSTELLEYVDEAISMLPEHLRHCVVGHFLEQRLQGDVATELGVSTRTVRRWTEEAMRRVREMLELRGIISSTSVVAGVLSGLTTDAVPTSLSISLGKIAMGSMVHTEHVGAWSVVDKAAHIGVMVIMKKGTMVGMVFVLGFLAWWLLGNSIPEEVRFSGETNTGVEFEIPTGADLLVAAPNSGGRDGVLIAPGDVSEVETSDLVAAAPMSLFDRSAYSPEKVKDPRKYASVAGVVTDEMGRAIADAHVTVVSTGFPVPATPSEDTVTRRSLQSHIEATYSSDEHQFDAVTDSQGEYLIENIPYLGRGNMGIDAYGFRHKLASLKLEAGKTTTLKTILTEGTAIHGKLITTSKQPVSDATVYSVAINSPTSTSGAYTLPRALQTRTDSAGEFTVWLPQSSEAVANLRVISDSMGEDLFKMVPAGEEERITLTFEPESGTLAGTIYEREGQGAAGHHVYLEGTIVSKFTTGNGSSYSSGAGAFLHTMTDEKGHYRLENIPVKSKYEVSILDSKGMKAAKVALERLSAGETTTWNYTLEEPIQISGTVRGAQSRTGMPKMIVNYARIDSDDSTRILKGRTHTDGDGRYAFKLVAGAGSYTFDVQLNPNGSIGDTSSLAQTLELAAADVETVNFEVPEPWSRLFQVIDQFGRPLEGIRPGKREIIDRNTLITIADSVTDTEGIIVLDNLASGSTVSFSFTEPGYISFETPRIEGEPGEVYPLETLVLYQTTSAVAQLVDTAGLVVSDAIVGCTVHFGDGRSASVKGATDANGWLLLEESLPASVVTLDILVIRDGVSTISGTISDVELAVDSMNELGVLNLSTTVVTTAP